MMIRTVKASNLLLIPPKKNEYDFVWNVDDEHTLITGPNGSGKSTLFHLIRLALYGVKHNSLLHDATQPASLELTLLYDGNKYVIERTYIKSWKCVITMVTDGKKRKMTQKDFEVLKYIPSTLFDYVYCFDNTWLTNLSPTMLRTIIVRILDLEALPELKKKHKEIYKNLVTQKARQEELNTRIELIKSKVPDSKVEVQLLQKTRELYDKFINTMEKHRQQHYAYYTNENFHWPSVILEMEHVINSTTYNVPKTFENCTVDDLIMLIQIVEKLNTSDHSARNILNDLKMLEKGGAMDINIIKRIRSFVQHGEMKSEQIKYYKAVLAQLKKRQYTKECKDRLEQAKQHEHVAEGVQVFMHHKEKGEENNICVTERLKEIHQITLALESCEKMGIMTHTDVSVYQDELLETKEEIVRLAAMYEKRQQDIDACVLSFLSDVIGPDMTVNEQCELFYKDIPLQYCSNGQKVKMEIIMRRRIIFRMPIYFPMLMIDETMDVLDASCQWKTMLHETSVHCYIISHAQRYIDHWPSGSARIDFNK